jgi:hypothetical protein
VKGAVGGPEQKEEGETMKDYMQRGHTLRNRKFSNRFAKKKGKSIMIGLP